MITSNNKNYECRLTVCSFNNVIAVLPQTITSSLLALLNLPSLTERTVALILTESTFDTLIMSLYFPRVGNMQNPYGSIPPGWTPTENSSCLALCVPRAKKYCPPTATSALNQARDYCLTFCNSILSGSTSTNLTTCTLTVISKCFLIYGTF